MRRTLLTLSTSTCVMRMRCAAAEDVPDASLLRRVPQVPLPGLPVSDVRRALPPALLRPRAQRRVPVGERRPAAGGRRRRLLAQAAAASRARALRRRTLRSATRVRRLIDTPKSEFITYAVLGGCNIIYEFSRFRGV